MCGIVGIIAKRPNQGFNRYHEDLFEELLYADALRGMDSTGVFAVSKKNQLNVLKQAVNPGIFLQTQSFKDFKSDLIPKSHIIVGHNRKATWGDVTSKNAHPFFDKDIVLVHNGYISNHKVLDSKVDVDSEAIITALAGEKEPTKAIEKLLGPFAIVWYNRKDQKLYMARNHERELHVIWGDNHIYLASEGEMLKWILSRNKISHPEPVLLTAGKVFEVSFNSFKVRESTLERRPLPQRYPVLPWDPAWANADDERLADEEDRAQMTELGRARQMAQNMAAANEGDTEGRVASLKHLYPGNTTVLFRPKGSCVHGEGTSKYVQVWGDMWMPGRPHFKGILNIPKAEDNELYMDVRHPLLATVDCIWRKNLEVGFVLKNLREGPDMVEDFNNLKMTRFEWESIVAALGCDSCAKPLKKHQLDSTIIIRVSDGYNVTCADCVGHATTPNKSSDTPLEEHSEGYSG